MSNVDIRAGFEARLATVPGALTSIQRENKKFEPVALQPYWRVHMFRGPTQNPSLGSAHRRYKGRFLITLAFPFDKGTGEAEALADAVAGHFSRGSTTTANQVRTVFDRDPDVKPGRVAGDRWEIPIEVFYYADVFG